MSLENKFYGTLETWGGTGILIGALYAIKLPYGDSIPELMFHLGLALVLIKEGSKALLQGIESLLNKNGGL